MSEKIEPGTIWERRSGGRMHVSRVRVLRVTNSRVYWIAHGPGYRDRRRGSVAPGNWRSNYDFWGRDV